MAKISHNLRYLRDLKKMSQETLADELRITRGRLGAYEEARNEPPIELLIRISEYFHISIDALVKGDLRKTDSINLMKIGKNRLLFPVIIDRDNNDQVEVVTARASAGYLNGYADPEYMEGLPRMNLPFAVTGKHRSFPIKGDSMPPLRSGDFVIGKYVESLKEIVNGKTYVLLTKDEGIVYKRVFRKERHSLELHSDNRLYMPYTVKDEDVIEVWEFVCCLATSDKKEEEINLESVMGMLRSMKIEIESIKK
jgi:transcriptional regulator with XRE-family HTH domain